MRVVTSGKDSFKDRSIVLKAGRRAVSVKENKREIIHDLCSREAISITALISTVSVSITGQNTI